MTPSAARTRTAGSWAAEIGNDPWPLRVGRGRAWQANPSRRWGCPGGRPGSPAPPATTWCVLVSWPLAHKLEAGARVSSSAAFVHENAYLQQYCTPSSCLSEAVGRGLASPRAFLRHRKRPQTQGVQPRAGAKAGRHDPLHVSSALEAILSNRPDARTGHPCLMSLTSGPWSPSPRTERPAASVRPRPSPRQPLAARPGPASWQASQSLAEGHAALGSPTGWT